MGDNIILMDKGIIMQRSTPKGNVSQSPECLHSPVYWYAAHEYCEQYGERDPGGIQAGKTSLIDPGDAVLSIQGRIITKEQLGAEMNYSIETAFGKVMVKTEDDIEGQECRLYIPGKECLCLWGGRKPHSCDRGD